MEDRMSPNEVLEQTYEGLNMSEIVDWEEYERRVNAEMDEYADRSNGRYTMDDHEVQQTILDWEGDEYLHEEDEDEQDLMF